MSTWSFEDSFYAKPTTKKGISFAKEPFKHFATFLQYESPYTTKFMYKFTIMCENGTYFYLPTVRPPLNKDDFLENGDISAKQFEKIGTQIVNAFHLHCPDYKGRYELILLAKAFLPYSISQEEYDYQPLRIQCALLENALKLIWTPFQTEEQFTANVKRLTKLESYVLLDVLRCSSLSYMAMQMIEGKKTLVLITNREHNHRKDAQNEVRIVYDDDSFYMSESWILRGTGQRVAF